MFTRELLQRMVTSLKPSPALQLHEYNIIDATGEVSQRIQRDDDADANVLTEGTSYFCCIYFLVVLYLFN